MTHKKSVPGLEPAQRVLGREAWTPTPLMPALSIGGRLGVELWLKREDCVPGGSFKLRGALVTMERLGASVPEKGVYVASSGNYGVAMALAGWRSGVPVTVTVPEGTTRSKLERIRLCGARVIQHGEDFDAAKDFARASAASDGAAFWEDGTVDEMYHGAATIGAELLDHPGPWDVVIVPIGNGSLMKGIAGVFKARSPRTRVVGVAPADAPAMALAMRGQPWAESASASTLADGLAVRVPIVEMVKELRPLVDEVWSVQESRLLPAVRTLMELEQVMAEPSAAITVAGLADHGREVSGKRVAAIITGAHLDLDLLPEIMAGEGLF